MMTKKPMMMMMPRNKIRVSGVTDRCMWGPWGSLRDLGGSLGGLEGSSGMIIHISCA